MNDELISKQKILNTLKEWQSEDLPHTMYGDGYEDAVSDIIKLIETEVPVGAETKVMNDDLISRQAVIDYLESISNMDPKERGAIIFSVELLPSVQPKTGRWEDIMVGDMPAQACDLCKTFFPMAYTGGGHHYCPNCGAKMEMK